MNVVYGKFVVLGNKSIKRALMKGGTDEIQ